MNQVGQYRGLPVGCADFTGKERDSETGNDYFGARYLSGAQGRFGSPDPGNAGAVNVDPQSWNAYGYVRNNPINLTDPDGSVMCRPASQDEQVNGVTMICDLSDADYMNSSTEQKYEYFKEGYRHYDSNLDSGADKDAWQHPSGTVSNDWVGDALMVAAALVLIRDLEDPTVERRP
jgi:RHS repeat-associated protein